jgi:hypothetical protein
MKKNILLYVIVILVILTIGVITIIPIYKNYNKNYIAKVLKNIDQKVENFEGVGLEFDWMRKDAGRPIMKEVMDFSRGPLLWSLHIDQMNIASVQITTDHDGEKVYRLIEKRPKKEGEAFSRVEVDVSVNKGMLKQVKKYDWKNKLIFLEVSSNLRLKSEPPQK